METLARLGSEAARAEHRALADANLARWAAVAPAEPPPPERRFVVKQGDWGDVTRALTRDTGEASPSPPPRPRAPPAAAHVLLAHQHPLGAAALQLWWVQSVLPVSHRCVSSDLAVPTCRAESPASRSRENRWLSLRAEYT